MVFVTFPNLTQIITILNHNSEKKGECNYLKSALLHESKRVNDTKLVSEIFIVPQIQNKNKQTNK